MLNAYVTKTRWKKCRVDQVLLNLQWTALRCAFFIFRLSSLLFFLLLSSPASKRPHDAYTDCVRSFLYSQYVTKLSNAQSRITINYLFCIINSASTRTVFIQNGNMVQFLLPFSFVRSPLICAPESTATIESGSLDALCTYKLGVARLATTDCTMNNCWKYT